MTSSRDRTLDEITRFRFAQSDMQQVVAAAEALVDEHADGYGHLGRALETALVVCYARPFSKDNAVGSLGHKWPPLKRFRDLHRELLGLRNRVYAHTDRTVAREVVEVSQLLGRPFSGSWTEAWHPIDPSVLPTIITLATELQYELAAAIHQRAARLDVTAKASD